MSQTGLGLSHLLLFSSLCSFFALSQCKSLTCLTFRSIILLPPSSSSPLPQKVGMYSITATRYYLPLFFPFPPFPTPPT
ncbi:hypothetical protein J3F84DRAFT_370162 [Trichoderma pleuroticola]